jgi:hypothetical protein
VLAALATCQEITYRAYATALGIPLDGVSVKHQLQLPGSNRSDYRRSLKARSTCAASSR